MITGGMGDLIDSLGALSRSMPTPLPCCGHEAEQHTPLCPECGAGLMHGHYCTHCRCRMAAVLACPGRERAVSEALAAEGRRVAWMRELGYAA